MTKRQFRGGSDYEAVSHFLRGLYRPENRDGKLARRAGFSSIPQVEEPTRDLGVIQVRPTNRVGLIRPREEGL